MENKKTTELLDLLWKLETSPEEKQNWTEYDEVYEEICKRTPFKQILGTNDDERDQTIQENIEDLLSDVKLLKRHKHDETSGDVMVRI